MLRFLLNLALSVAVSNWIYDELILAEPALKKPLDKFVDLITIPTHPHWFGGNGSKIMRTWADDAIFVVERIQQSRSA